MADSNITKRALADAIKALMQEMPFEKINVAHICERCDGLCRRTVPGEETQRVEKQGGISLWQLFP